MRTDTSTRRYKNEEKKKKYIYIERKREIERLHRRWHRFDPTSIASFQWIHFSAGLDLPRSSADHSTHRTSIELRCHVDRCVGRCCVRRGGRSARIMDGGGSKCNSKPRIVIHGAWNGARVRESWRRKLIFAIPVIVRVRQVYAGISGREKLAWRLVPYKLQSRREEYWSQGLKTRISSSRISSLFLIREDLCESIYHVETFVQRLCTLLFAIVITWKGKLTRLRVRSRNCEWNFKVFGVGNWREF